MKEVIGYKLNRAMAAIVHAKKTAANAVDEEFFVRELNALFELKKEILGLLDD